MQHISALHLRYFSLLIMQLTVHNHNTLLVQRRIQDLDWGRDRLIAEDAIV